VIDRDGRLVGKYSRQHPTDEELALGVIPGTMPACSRPARADRGRGLLRCQRARGLGGFRAAAGGPGVLAAAYEGGFPLRAYAAIHHIPIVTSVWPFVTSVWPFGGGTRSRSRTLTWTGHAALPHRPAGGQDRSSPAEVRPSPAGGGLHRGACVHFFKPRPGPPP
jgi:hypothetical protein